MELTELENRIYNFSVDLIGFMITLKKENCESSITTAIVKNAGLLNTYYIDSMELTGQEYRLMIGKCIMVSDTLLSLFKKLKQPAKYNKSAEKYKTILQEILTDIETDVANPEK